MVSSKVKQLTTVEGSRQFLRQNSFDSRTAGVAVLRHKWTRITSIEGNVVTVSFKYPYYKNVVERDAVVREDLGFAFEEYLSRKVSLQLVHDPDAEYMTHAEKQEQERREQDERQKRKILQARKEYNQKLRELDRGNSTG